MTKCSFPVQVYSLQDISAHHHIADSSHLHTQAEHNQLAAHTLQATTDPKLQEQELKVTLKQSLVSAHVAPLWTSLLRLDPCRLSSVAVQGMTDHMCCCLSAAGTLHTRQSNDGHVQDLLIVGWMHIDHRWGNLL
jgi:hypothetical protein